MDQQSDLRRGRAFPAGLALGALLGFAYLVAPVIVIPGLLAVAWLLSRFPRLAALSGAFVGFGLMWLVVIARVTWACSTDPSCVEPNVTFWLAIGVVLLAAGLLLGLAARLLWQR